MIEANTVIVPPAPCPHCGSVLDCASGFAGAREPIPGDVTVCMDCANVIQFTDGLQLKMVDENHLAEFDVEMLKMIYLMVDFAIKRIALKQQESENKGD